MAKAHVGSAHAPGARYNLVHRVWARDKVLRAGLRAAQERFGGQPWVRGFGIGVKYSEQHEHKVLGPNGRGLPCVVIAVAQKRATRLLPPRHRVPRYLWVRIAGQKKRQRVWLDVCAVGKHARQQSELRPREGPSWPTAGALQPGCRMTCGKAPPPPLYQPFNNVNAELGTVGAVVQAPIDGPDYYATTAAHVLMDTLHGGRDLQLAERAIGVLDQNWVRVMATDFTPATIALGGFVEDAAVFRVPQGQYNNGENYNFLAPYLTWPSGFKGGFATSADVRHAKTSGADQDGFIWVQRYSEQPVRSPILVRLPISLIDGLDELKIDVNSPGQAGVRMTYGAVYHYVMIDRLPEGGDSGAPVFIYARDNPSEPRLLGFHFLASEDVRKWFAVCAENFLSRRFGALGEDFSFVGTE